MNLLACCAIYLRKSSLNGTWPKEVERQVYGWLTSMFNPSIVMSRALTTLAFHCDPVRLCFWLQTAKSRASPKDLWFIFPFVPGNWTQNSSKRWGAARVSSTCLVNIGIPGFIKESKLTIGQRGGLQRNQGKKERKLPAAAINWRVNASWRCV